MSIAPELAAAMKAVNAIFVEEVAPTRNVARLDRVYTADARIPPPGSPVIRRL
jgi:hypothetical protein